jgi:ribosome biogenesis protein SSF1/2
MTEKEIDSVPKSMVLKRTTLPKEIKILLKDIRQLMYPFTAMKLKESTKMKLKDICKFGYNFGVTNLLMLFNNENKNYLKMSGNGRGPTSVFRIEQFILSKDIQNKLPRNKIINSEHLGVPLSLCKGFDGENLELYDSDEVAEAPADLKKYLGVIKSQFKNLFPSVKNNSQSVYKNAKRVVLFTYNADKNVFELRNYHIKKSFSGMNKGIKKLLNNERLMDFSKVGDVSELFLANKAELSESDIDNLQSKIEVEKKTQGNKIKTEVSIRLQEIGPRMTLKLIKLQDDFHKGEVLYHGIVKKSEDEKDQIRKKIQEKIKLKEKRRLEQEENVKRKELAKRDHQQFLEDNKKKKGDDQNEEDEEEVDEIDDLEEVEEEEVGGDDEGDDEGDDGDEVNGNEDIYDDEIDPEEEEFLNKISNEFV